MGQSPVLKHEPTASGPLQTLRSVITERTGLAVGAITAVACLVFSVALWNPFTWPSDTIRGAIPIAACTGKSGAEASICAVRAAATPLAGPLALMGFAFVFRKALSAVVNAVKRRIPGSGALLAALLATVVFVLSWAGSHASRPMETGLLPQIAFPALVGFSTYAIGRWGPLLHRGLRLYFEVRDHVPMKLRMLIVMAVPTGASLWLAAGSGATRGAYNEQLVVLIGIAVGFLIVAPRPKQGGPSA